VYLPQSEQYVMSPACCGGWIVGLLSRVLPQYRQYKVTLGAFSSVIVFSLLCTGSCACVVASRYHAHPIACPTDTRPREDTPMTAIRQIGLETIVLTHDTAIAGDALRLVRIRNGTIEEKRS
jgi:hypothetical protein